MKNNRITTYDMAGKSYDVSADELVWRPSAYGIVIRNNEILLVKQNGIYLLPGGGINLGEKPEDAVVREVREETGIEVVNPKFKGLENAYFTWVESERVHAQALLLYYTCDYIGGSFENAKLDKGEKASNLTPEWVSLNQVSSLAVGSVVDWRLIIK